MLLEFSEFVRNYIGVRHKIKLGFAILLLQLTNIDSKFVLASQFSGGREMVNFLVLIQPFV